jgi:hypothetical protein
MKKPADNKVNVHVEVLVSGAGATPVRTTVNVECPARSVIKSFRQIDKPQPSPANTPLCKVGPNLCVEASGKSDQVSGSFATTVFALAFCGTDVTTQQFPQPPLGVVSDIPDPDTGAWSFNVAKGNAVPGACCDGISGGPNNSTLIVWYQFDDDPPTFSADSTPFHGYCPGSGSGSPGGIGKVVVGSQVLPAALHATFTGALSPLGTVALAWNGVSWVGKSSHAGGLVLSLTCRDAAFQLHATGPCTTFVVAGKPSSLRPFHWSVRGQAIGTLAGAFELTVLE